MNPKMTRRQALLATAGVAATTLIAAQDKKPADGKSWVGLTVLLKADGPTASRAMTFPKALPRPMGLPDGQNEFSVPVGLSDVSYTVKAEKDGRVQVIGDDGWPAWAERESFVPLSEAVAFFTEQLKQPVPSPAGMLNSRGWAHKLLGNRPDALKDFDAALVAAPNWADALTNRGLTYAEGGQFDKATADLNALFQNPITKYNQAVTSLGYAHELRGDFERAVGLYRFAADNRSILAANNLAWVRATCPDPKHRDWTEAVCFARIVCDRTDNLEGMYLDTLAAAMAETARFDDAAKTQELALKDKSYDLIYGDEGRARLKLYQQKKPFRTDPPKK